MTDQEIDKWVEEHIVVPDDVSEEEKPLYDDIVPAITQWGKNIAKKFYKLGKSEIPINLTWQDIREIVLIADKMLDDPEARIAYQNHNEEYYYKKVLESWKGKCHL